MPENKKTSLVVFMIIIVLFVVGGFYFILNETKSLREDIKNLELTMVLSEKQGELVSEIAAPATTTAPIQPIQDNEKIIVIPTAIIFDATSSPALAPQTKITLTIQNVSKNEDGTIYMDIKAFTSEASTYSALEPRDIFEILDLETDGALIKAFKTEGTFSSIPPKSAMLGRLTFKIDPAKNTMILQINLDNGELKHYEFDFGNKAYTEKILG